MLLYKVKGGKKMLLANLRKVLESEALDSRELVGFFTALFIEEDALLGNAELAAEARNLLYHLRPLDAQAQAIWLKALDRLDAIYQTTRRRERGEG